MAWSLWPKWFPWLLSHDLPTAWLRRRPSRWLKALDRADLSLDDISLIEINEAFAAVPLVTMLKLADRDRQKVKKLHAKANVNGSAIAIGHPNTASGARVLMNLLYELRRRGGGYALGAICGGLAQADACILKV